MHPPTGSPWGHHPQPPSTSTAAPPTSTAWSPRPSSATASLDNELQTWLVVTCLGWFVGLMWITGPLGWWKANELRARYAAMGAAEPSNVNILRLIGIVTTVLSALGIVGACMTFIVFGMFAVGAAGAAGGH